MFQKLVPKRPGAYTRWNLLSEFYGIYTHTHTHIYIYIYIYIYNFIYIYIYIYIVNLEKVVHLQIYKYKDISHT